MKRSGRSSPRACFNGYNVRMKSEIITDPPKNWPSGNVVFEQRQTATIGTSEYLRQGTIYNGIHSSTSIDKHHFTKTAGDGPDVACGDCLGTSFELYIGGYECAARCINCQKECVVYDG